MDDAVSGVVVGDESGHYVAVNVGTGIALNVSYFFSRHGENRKDERRKITGSYLPSVLPNHSQQIQLALMVNSHAGDHQITFFFQESRRLAGTNPPSCHPKPYVIIDFGMRQLLQDFQPERI